jgi:hypothetical protein
MSFDPKKPVQISDGRKARIICSDLKGDRPIVALIETVPGEEMIYTFRADGSYQPMSPDFYLVNIPVRKSVWLNIYRSADIKTIWQPSRSIADANAGLMRTAVLELVFEDDKPANAILHRG